MGYRYKLLVQIFSPRMKILNFKNHSIENDNLNKNSELPEFRKDPERTLIQGFYVMETL